MDIVIGALAKDILSEDDVKKFQRIMNMIQLVRDVATEKKTVTAALEQIGITSDTVIKRIQGVFECSKSGFLNAIARTDFTKDLVGTAQDIAVVLHGFYEGSITPEECIEQLFDRGFEEINVAIASALSVIEVPNHAPAFLNDLLNISGVTFCYEAFELVVNEIAVSLKEARVAKRERILIEKQCAEMLEEMIGYRSEIKALTEEYFTEHYETLEAGFDAMDQAILHDDIDNFIRGNAVIQKQLGYDVQFETQDEFDKLMESDEAFRL